MCACFSIRKVKGKGEREKGVEGGGGQLRASTRTTTNHPPFFPCLSPCLSDFTYVCPTEITAFNDRASDFAALNCQVIAASTDTEETHAAWTRVPRAAGGLGKMDIPIVADTTKAIAAR